MIKYSNFLFSILVKKKSLYFIFALFCLVFSGMLLAMNSAETTKEQSLFPITTFIKWFPFVFSTIFILLVIVRIFKVTEQDGTELLISAKPMSRMQIIFAKFFVLLVLMIIFQLFTFVFFLIISQVDDKATSQQKLEFAATLSIGGLIASLIMGSIIIIISSLIGRIGTIVIGILFAACVPILSFVIIPFSNAQNPIIDRRNVVYNYLSQTTKTENIYDPKQQTTKLSEITFLPFHRKEDIEKNHDSWYQQAKYFDVWYQWNRFYSLMEPKVVKINENVHNVKYFDYKVLNEQDFNVIFNEARKTSIKTYAENISGDFEKTGEELGFFSSDEIAFEKQFLPQVFNKTKYDELTKDNGTLATELKKLDADLFIAFAQFSIRDAIEEGDLDKKSTTFLTKRLQTLFGLEKSIPLKNYRILLWRAINDFQNNILASENTDLYPLLNVPGRTTIFSILFHSRIYGQSAINTRNYLNEDGSTISFKRLSQNYFVVSHLRKKEFLSTNLVIILWSTIGFILLMTSIVIYSRRDFR